MDNSISSMPLKNGKKVALGAIEILSIPHISTIDNGSAEEIVHRYKREAESLLNELFQLFQSMSMAKGFAVDVALELLWLTERVENQTFRARIRLFIIVRAIHEGAAQAEHITTDFLGLLRSSLTMLKYDHSNISYAELSTMVAQIDDMTVKAIVKEEKAADLQNQYLPFCYSYGRFASADNDLSGLVNILIQYPNAAVSMQLIPTVFTHQETAILDNIAQNLGLLNRGIMNHGVGNISYALAEKHADAYKYYAERKSAPLFRFNIMVYGNTEAVGDIASKVYGQISFDSEKSASFKIIDLTRNETRKDTNFYPLPWAVGERLIHKGRNPQIWNSRYFPKSLYRLPYIITGEEAAEFFRLPIGSNRISAGLSINEAGKQNKTYTANIINSGDITIGKLKTSSNNDTIGLSLNDLTKHMLVVGTPGSGKTTFSISLLDRLWKEHGIPFLVIEPAKNEYRALVQSIPDLQVFTPGKSFISPFVFNPFIPPKNVRLESYKSTLKTAFAAAVSMTTPLDKIFENAINECYSRFRWLDTYTTDDKGQVFNIADFVKCFEETFEAIGYKGEAQNIGRAGVVRLQGLVNLFDNYYSIPIEEFLSKPTVIELAAIEDSQQKSLLIALILLSILSYVNANYTGDGSLRNIILLEEAHVLLDADGSAAEGDARPAAIAQGLVKRMLAELRSSGVGLIIADQSPKKVTADVVALTDIKASFRLVESDDRHIIAGSTGMAGTQEERLSKLRPGEAFLFFGRLDEPEEIVTPDYRLENKISISLKDSEITRLSTYWQGKETLLRPYPQCALCRECEKGCDLDQRVLGRQLARRIFSAHFRPSDKTFEPVHEVFGQITRLTKQELGDEKLTHALFNCTKVHLWRSIRYNTRIPVQDIQIERSLKL